MRDKTGHPICAHTSLRRHAQTLCPNSVPRSLHTARDTAVVLFYRRYYFSLAFRYCILVRPVYPFVRFQRPWLATHLLLLPRTTGPPHRQRKGEREKGTSISRDVKRPPFCRVSGRNPCSWELYFARRDRKPTSHCSPPCTRDVQRYDFTYKRVLCNFYLRFVLNRTLLSTNLAKVLMQYI